MEPTTPQPAHGGDETPPDRPRRTASSRKIALAIVVALLLGAGALAVWMAGNMADGPGAQGTRVRAPTPSAAATPEPAPVAPPVPPPTDYVVEPGDSLLGIAIEFNTSVEALRLANGLANVDMVRIGQVLVIPPPATLIQPVEPTRTLRDIAFQYGEDPAVLAAYNGIDPVQVGAPLGRDAVILPDRARLAAPPPGDQDAQAQMTYTVAEGDTLLSIAIEFGVEPEAILAANQLADPNLIVVGQELVIPVAE